MVLPGLEPPTIPLQNRSQPKAIEKASGQVFVIVRDDVAANGKLYIAPIGMMTSMRSIKPEEFRENFTWYTPTEDRPLPVREIAANDTQQLPLTPDSIVAQWPEGRTVDDPPAEAEAAAPKKRGRPVGSKNKKRTRKRTPRIINAG